MKDIKMFYLKSCPFCKSAITYLNDLLKETEYQHLKVEMIEESEQSDLANSYDYYFVPCFFVDGKKMAEGMLSKGKVEKVLKAAL